MKSINQLINQSTNQSVCQKNSMTLIAMQKTWYHISWCRSHFANNLFIYIFLEETGMWICLLQVYKTLLTWNCFSVPPKRSSWVTLEFWILYTQLFEWHPRDFSQRWKFLVMWTPLRFLRLISGIHPKILSESAVLANNARENPHRIFKMILCDTKFVKPMQVCWFFIKHGWLIQNVLDEVCSLICVSIHW